MDKQSPELDVLSYGCIDSLTHNTSAGNDSPLSTPPGWVGDEKAYLDLLRGRFLFPHYAQRLLRASRFVNAPSYTQQLRVSGTYKEAAISVLNKSPPSDKYPDRKTVFCLAVFCARKLPAICPSFCGKFIAREHSKGGFQLNRTRCFIKSSCA